MSRPRFFSVPATVADGIVNRSLRKSWTDTSGETRVLLSASDLFAYGIERAMEAGAEEMTRAEVQTIINKQK